MKTKGFEYYECLLCYVDDILSISHFPDVTMDGIIARFTLKDNNVEEPTDYMGAQISKMKDKFVNEFWTLSSSKYCKAAITNVEKRLVLAEKWLPTKYKTPKVTKYSPDMDVTAELKYDGIQYFQ